MPGPLSGGRRDTGDVNLTGGASTSVWNEPNQDARQVRRSAHQERLTREGDFKVGVAMKAGPMKQPPAMSNLHAKAEFKKRRFRK